MRLRVRVGWVLLFALMLVLLGCTSWPSLELYGISGTPRVLTTQSNLLFVGTDPGGKLETLSIQADGSLSTLGAVDVGGNPTDVEAIILP